MQKVVKMLKDISVLTIVVSITSLRYKLVIPRWAS